MQFGERGLAAILCELAATPRGLADTLRGLAAPFFMRGLAATPATPAARGLGDTLGLEIQNGAIWVTNTQNMPYTRFCEFQCLIVHGPFNHFFVLGLRSFH